MALRPSFGRTISPDPNDFSTEVPGEERYGEREAVPPEAGPSPRPVQPGAYETRAQPTPVPVGLGGPHGDNEDPALLQHPPGLTPPQRALTTTTVGEALAGLIHDVKRIRSALDFDDVVDVTLVQLDAQGAAELDLAGPQQVGSVAVVNYAATSITVSGSGRQTSTPIAGTNTFLVGSSGMLQVPILSRYLTVYGAANARVLIVRFASVKPVTAGIVGPVPFA